VAEWRLSHRQDGNEYELGIAWNDDSFINGTPEIEISATVRRRDWDAPRTIAVTVGLEEREGSPVLILSAGGKPILGVPLADLLDESQIIDRIPAWIYGGGDPLTGCLLRAGLSSVVGQVIRCKNETRGIDNWYFDRMRAMGGCLKTNVGRIGSRTALRAAKCALAAGF
jgi:hypothetical protein